MKERITYEQTLARFHENRMEYRELPLANGYRAVIAARGGRVFGPFRADEEAVLWQSDVFRDPEAFRGFVKSDAIHLGGERMWIGPELEFFCNAPKLFDATYTVQPSLDPGSFAFSEETHGGVRLGEEAEQKILRGGDGHVKRALLTRTYLPAPNPLQYVRQLNGVRADYCGFTQDIRLRDDSPETPLYLEPWILTQIHPGGRILVPYLGSLEFDDYYTPVDRSVMADRGGYAELVSSGRRKYKTAFKAANTFGRMGYVLPQGDGRWVLMIRNYYSDPSIPYCSEPWHDLGCRGCSMYFYNDDGSNGGFTEFENSCAMVGLDANREESFSTTSLWFFYGDSASLEKIIKVLLGVDYSIGRAF